MSRARPCAPAAWRSASFAARICIARALFWCWLRSFWHETTIPVGRWVRRTAESVLLTCWPPAPDDRYVSIRRSFSSMSISPHRVFQERNDRDRGEARLAPLLRIERRHAHEPVHAAFG